MHATQCSQATCPLNEGGLCLEGFDLNNEECPHALFEEEGEELEVDDEVESDNYSEEPVEDVEEGINLFSGDAMSNNELHTVTFAHFTKLILIMGEPDSGKTTLLATIFNMFQKGNYAGFLFAGSKTQVGFEKRCHLARLASGRITPEIERTTSDEFSYLHLAVRDMSLSQPTRHLLFTDVSGERFRLVRDSDEELERLTILKHATEVFYIVNGEHLASSSLRHATKANAIKMLNRITQSMNNTYAINGVRIIISKWDKVIEGDAQQKVAHFFIDPILIKYPTLITQVEKVATRSEITGLDVFLQTCAAPIEQVVNHESSSMSKSSREFCRLQPASI